MQRHFYAAYNDTADLIKGEEGRPRGWRVVRFSNKALRDDFVETHYNRRAKSITRMQANHIWRDSYLCQGLEPPVGGLFYQPREFQD